MNSVLQRVEVTLRSFYIFNSEFGKKEGEEHKKVLYYHPSDIELNTKIRDVGLSEAIIAFSGTFGADDDCKALHTKKTTQLFYQPESGYWMVLVVNVPKEIQVKDGVDISDFRGGEVNDRIYRSLLKHCYNMFLLFSGTFIMNLSEGSKVGDDARNQLQQRLQIFFDKYLQSLKLPVCDVMNIMRSIQYLPLDQFLFLRAHNLINTTRATFSTIKETIFLYNEQIVCSGKLDGIDLYCLHEYIVDTILAKTQTQTESSGTVLVRSNSTSSEIYRNGAFVLGPDEDKKDIIQPIKVYLKIGNALEKLNLIVYRASNVTLCLFVNGDEEFKSDFYKELHSYIGPQLVGISRDIGETLTKQQQQQTNKKAVSAATILLNATNSSDSDTVTPKYLFINDKSLKHLTNIAIDRRHPKFTQNMPLNVINLIADLGNRNSDEDDGDDNIDINAFSTFQEVQIKTTNDFWIVKRRCNWRQYYVIIFNSKPTLLDVAYEAKRLFEQELTNDVFFDK